MQLNRILITGGAGFIGSHIAEHYSGRCEVRILDDLRTGHRRNLQGVDAEWIEGSILDRSAVRSAMRGVDAVFHLAAMVSVPESMERPSECVDINVKGLLTVLECAREAGVQTLCLSSSAAVYGDNPEVPKREDMMPEPRSPYAITKLSGEYYCDLFAREKWLRTACLRYFNVFGPRQDPNSQYAAAVPIFITRALRNQPITIFGDGEQTRDFIYVKDVVAANVFAAENPGIAGVFNVAYGGRLTINDLAENIVRLTGSTSEILHGSERPGDVRHSSADVDRLRLSGFEPTADFDSGLAETIRFFSPHS
ncbi:MAG: NAD-dependent epimerase/dehydratase family protein [Verrucomicrobiota bacterium]